MSTLGRVAAWIAVIGVVMVFLLSVLYVIFAALLPVAFLLALIRAISR